MDLSGFLGDGGGGLSLICDFSCEVLALMLCFVSIIMALQLKVFSVSRIPQTIQGDFLFVASAINKKSPRLSICGFREANALSVYTTFALVRYPQISDRRRSI
jgi:hypothetical protein